LKIKSNIDWKQLFVWGWKIEIEFRLGKLKEIKYLTEIIFFVHWINWLVDNWRSSDGILSDIEYKDWINWRDLFGKDVTKQLVVNLDKNSRRFDGKFNSLLNFSRVDLLNGSEFYLQKETRDKIQMNLFLIKLLFVLKIDIGMRIKK
jgi:hypothetical protein